MPFCLLGCRKTCCTCNMAATVRISSEQLNVSVCVCRGRRVGSSAQRVVCVCVCMCVCVCVCVYVCVCEYTCVQVQAYLCILFNMRSLLICWMLPLATQCHTHYHLHPFHFSSNFWLLSNTQQCDIQYTV